MQRIVKSCNKSFQSCARQQGYEVGGILKKFNKAIYQIVLV